MNLVRVLDYCIAAWLIAIVLLLAAGCTKSQTREDVAIDKTDKISVTGSLTVPTADGPRAVPIAFTIDRTGTEDQRKESQTKSGMDGAAIGREIASVLGPVLAASTGGGFSWANILTGVGAAATAATTGYLALAKRSQMKLPPKKG